MFYYVIEVDGVWTSHGDDLETALDEIKDHERGVIHWFATEDERDEFISTHE